MSTVIVLLGLIVGGFAVCVALIGLPNERGGVKPYGGLIPWTAGKIADGLHRVNAWLDARQRP